jgi:predicted flap endonuclease-1-like 5' DNA nuclease
MPIPTELVLTVGGVALAIAGAAAYSALTGNSASVDYDDDGNDEITFDGDSDTESGGYEGDQAIDPAYNNQIETEPSPYNNTPPEDRYGGTDEENDEYPNEAMSVEIPTSVQEIGENLASIRGIGPNRADTFRQAGFETAEDLWAASDEEILAVHGIGDRALTQIRGDVGRADANSEKE